VKKLNIHLTQKERQSLMRRMDLDANGQISS
jgi:Ca2+-binding EF-hand superfamily protein